MINKVLFIIYVIYCFEVGLFLVFFPWMELWDQNALLSYAPYLRDIVQSNYLRGAVTGLGLVNILLGSWEVANFLRSNNKPAVEPSDSIRNI